jgi:ABC-2 type transport system ATP-binding protein
MTTAFSLSHVSKQFKRQLALDDVSLSSEPGVVVALLGENGAGKTTAIRILLGLLEPDAGEATVLGLDSRRQGLEIRRRVGYVPDQPALYDWMTVEEAGWFVAGFYPLGFQRHYNELVEHFELPHDRKIKDLSKGMRAKVSLSLAMGHKPELLILDEPTSGLDPMVRREFLESMVDIAGQGRTVLLASHQIAEVERVADVVAILREGKLALVERLEDLKAHVCELTVTLHNGSPDLPPVPGTVLHREFKGRQWRLLVRNMDESRFEQFRTDTEVGNVEVRRPSLEEIFVGYMKGAAVVPDGGPMPL